MGKTQASCLQMVQSFVSSGLKLSLTICILFKEEKPQSDQSYSLTLTRSPGDEQRKWALSYTLGRVCTHDLPIRAATLQGRFNTFCMLVANWRCKLKNQTYLVLIIIF